MSAFCQMPAGFEPLQVFVPMWAGPTLASRDEARLGSTAEERAAFYDAAGPLAAAALDHLGARPLAEFTPSERALMNLMLSLVHVALAVELQGDDEPLHAVGARHMPITRGHADPRQS